MILTKCSKKSFKCVVGNSFCLSRKHTSKVFSCSRKHWPVYRKNFTVKFTKLKTSRIAPFFIYSLLPKETNLFIYLKCYATGDLIHMFQAPRQKAFVSSSCDTLVWRFKDIRRITNVSYTINTTSIKLFNFIFFSENKKGRIKFLANFSYIILSKKTNLTPINKI